MMMLEFIAGIECSVRVKKPRGRMSSSLKFIRPWLDLSRPGRDCMVGRGPSRTTSKDDNLVSHCAALHARSAILLRFRLNNIVSEAVVEVDSGLGSVVFQAPTHALVGSVPWSARQMAWWPRQIHGGLINFVVGPIEFVVDSLVPMVDLANLTVGLAYGHADYDNL
jgi:hypothetical protein